MSSLFLCINVGEKCKIFQCHAIIVSVNVIINFIYGTIRSHVKFVLLPDNIHFLYCNGHAPLTKVSNIYTYFFLFAGTTFVGS